MVHNPALALAQIISKLHDPDNSVAVPGFYDDVLTLSAEERAELEIPEIPRDALSREYMHAVSRGAKRGYTLRERQQRPPDAGINGLLSGWTADGAKRCCPRKRWRRLAAVWSANPRTRTRFTNWSRRTSAQITPPTVTSELKLLISAGFPALVDIHTPEMQAACAPTSAAGARRRFSRAKAAASRWSRISTSNSASP